MNKLAVTLAAIGWLSVSAFAAVANDKPIVVAQIGEASPGPDGPGPGPGGPGPGRYDGDRGDRYGYGDRDRGGYGYRDDYAPRPRCRMFRDSYGELHRRCRY